MGQWGRSDETRYRASGPTEPSPKQTAGGSLLERVPGRAPPQAARAVPELAGQLLVAQDEERRRIARELRDGPASTLVALSLDLARLVERLPAGEGRELAASCASLCEQSLRELRTMAFVLHPPLLEHEGLVVALRWLADGFGKRSGIHVTFEAGLAKGVRFQPHVELTLYRIAQEALTNVLRHSGSRTAHVAVTASSDDVRLTIRDEGRRPTDERDLPAGVGISSMRERLRALGGRLRLAFRRSGTVVIAVVPRGARAPG